MIPVEEARHIGQKYGKDMVVILAYDHESEQTDTSTWGQSAQDKEVAVNARDMCMDSILRYQGEMDTHQDYRHIEEGERAEVIDSLVNVLRDAGKYIEATNLVNPSEELDRLMKDIAAAIEVA